MTRKLLPDENDDPWDDRPHGVITRFERSSILEMGIVGRRETISLRAREMRNANSARAQKRKKKDTMHGKTETRGCDVLVIVLGVSLFFSWTHQRGASPMILHGERRDTQRGGAFLPRRENGNLPLRHCAIVRGLRGVSATRKSFPRCSTCCHPRIAESDLSRRGSGSREASPRPQLGKSDRIHENGSDGVFCHSEIPISGMFSPFSLKREKQKKNEQTSKPRYGKTRRDPIVDHESNDFTLPLFCSRMNPSCVRKIREMRK